MRIALALALVACHPTPRRVLVPVVIPLPVVVPVPVSTPTSAVFSSDPPGKLPSDRILTRTVTGNVHYDPCPSDKDLYLWVDHVQGVDEPDQIDAIDDDTCKLLFAGPGDPDYRHFTAVIRVHAQWRAPGCDQGDTKTWCHGWEPDYRGILVSLTPLTSPAPSH